MLAKLQFRLAYNECYSITICNNRKGINITDIQEFSNPSIPKFENLKFFVLAKEYENKTMKIYIFVGQLHGMMGRVDMT